jgi:hypothetical protein
MKSNRRKSQRGLHTQVPTGNGNEQVEIAKDVRIVVVKITPEVVQFDTEAAMGASIAGMMGSTRTP